METITITMTRQEAKNLIYFEEPSLSKRLEDGIRQALRESKKNQLRLKAITDLEAFLTELVEDDYF